MTDIGSNTPTQPRLSAAGPSHASSHAPSHGSGKRGWLSSLDHWLDTSWDALANHLTRCLCRASRGYLCPPDMHIVMYPDEKGPAEISLTRSTYKECCGEKLRKQ